MCSQFLNKHRQLIFQLVVWQLLVFSMILLLKSNINQNSFNKIITKRQSPMIESPIRRKLTNYPKDFLPNPQKTTQQKRFTFNQDYQIDVTSIQKYQKSIEQQPSQHQQVFYKSLQDGINPQIALLSGNELQQQDPLDHHLSSKKHNLDENLLKKPRFTMLQKEIVNENQENHMQSSLSPGCIRKQLLNRQAPLPKEDTCRIQLLISNNQINKLSNSIIKFKSTGQFLPNQWKPTKISALDNPKETRTKLHSVSQLPKVSKVIPPQSASFAAAKQQFDNFRKRQQSLGASFSKVSSFLTSMHKKESSLVDQLPHFQPSIVEKLKNQINNLAKKKKGKQKKEQSQYSQDQEEEQYSKEQQQEHKQNKMSRNHINEYKESQKPELLVSYRSSLSYLKDLYIKAEHLHSYNLVVKIPKIFTQKIIFKQQQRQELYEAAKSIFLQLKIQCQNLVIKRYTNCTMIVSRNICLIWHFEGRRYLGGWQSQYLDQGFKHGLGLQWQPKNYVYYGEFVKNKKHGLGIYKDRNENSYVGYWKKGKKVSSQEMNDCESQKEGEYELQYGQEEQASYYDTRAFQYL